MIAQELSALGHRLDGLETRLAAVEKVNRRLEDAALTTARALAEISGHWDAVLRDDASERHVPRGAGTLTVRERRERVPARGHSAGTICRRGSGQRVRG
jgi:hypothetical protein